MPADLKPAIEAAAQAMRDANTPGIWDSAQLVPMGALAKAAIKAALPELRKAIAEELVQLIEAEAAKYDRRAANIRLNGITDDDEHDPEDIAEGYDSLAVDLRIATAIVRGQSGGGDA